MEVQPGKVATVGVLENDSDPSGYTLSLDRKLLEVDPGITATVERGKVVVEAPKKEGTFSIHYGISNGHGGTDDAFLTVKVTKDAAPVYPTALDKYLPVDSVIGKSTVPVPLDGLIADPGGRDTDLKISVEGPNAARASVDQAKRSITVTPTDHRIAIAYRVTSSSTGLSATAILSVPPAVGAGYAPPPYLRRDLKLPQAVPENGAKTWKLADIVTVPSKKAPVLADPIDISAIHGTVSANGHDGITFTAEPGYRGSASVTFQVTDGILPALLTMTITVGDPNFSDVAPQFVTQNVTVEAGEDAKTVDLRASTTHPNPALISTFDYGSLTGQTDEITAGLSDGKLTVSSPVGTQPGATAALHFVIRYQNFSVPGTVNVTVVSSTRPLPQANPDTAKGQRSVTDTVNVLANDFNPFASKNEPLTVVDASIENAAESSATMTFTKTGDITIHPGASFIGVVSVVYTVQDATKDPKRQVQGRLQYTVRDVPGKPNAPSYVEGDGQVTVQWEAPATNGEPISSYLISWSGGSPVTVPGTDASHVFTGLSNGTGYTFRITASNALGAGEISDSSSTATPFGAPAQVTGASLSAAADGSGTLILSWDSANGNGRDITGYHITLSDGTQKDVGAVVTTTMPGHVGTAYTFTVSASNAGGRSGPASAASNSATPKPGSPTASASANNKTVTYSWGAAASTEPVSYTISGDGISTQTVSAPGSLNFTGSYGTSYHFTITATSAGQVTSATSNTVTPVDPYNIHLCYGSPGPNGFQYLGVAWGGNDGSNHHVTFSGYGSTLDFSAASGSKQSGAYHARNTAGDLNAVITWTDNGTSHSTRWGDAPAC